MNKKEFFDLAYPSILSIINDEGYKWVKSKEALVKKTTFGFEKIELFIDFNATRFDIKLVLSIRISKVEEIVNQFRLINPAYISSTTTHAVSYGDFYSDQYMSFIGYNHDDIIDISKIIGEFLNNNGLQYLDRCNDLGYLEQLYNEDTESSFVKNKETSVRLFYGVVFAFLTQKSNPFELAIQYRGLVANMYNPVFSVEKFDDLIRYLENNR